MSSTPDPDLMRIFDFTTADLEANRAGHIAEHQSQHLLKEVSLFGVWFILVYFIAVVVMFRNFGTALFLIIPFQLILCIVVIATAMYNKQIVVSDVGLGIVSNVSGTIKRQSRRNGGDIIISDRTLKVSLHENKNLKEYLKKIPIATQFRVYYVPKSKKVVAMEIIAS